LLELAGSLFHLCQKPANLLRDLEGFLGAENNQPKEQ
jgi:hypothetical protein